jgi:outer membrane protein, heavy metal efflux system
MRGLVIGLFAVGLACGVGLPAMLGQANAQTQVSEKRELESGSNESSSARDEVPPLDLAALWNLALANNPTLVEAAAEAEAAGGRLTQAAKYPNPRFVYRESVLGTRQDPTGDLTLEASQEIVTAGKRRLDIAIAASGVNVASLAYQGKVFEALTRVRRLYSDYLSWQTSLQFSGATVAALEEGVEITRRHVEEAQIRPRTDLVRLRAVLQEARLRQSRAKINALATWRRLAAEVGLPDLPVPETVPERAAPPPHWELTGISDRIITSNTELKLKAAETERARIELDRAKAGAVPNVTVGGGYSANYPEKQHGALISIEAPLPLWDRKEGAIREAQARWAKAQAAERSAGNRLLGEAAEAFGRYRSSLQEVEEMTGSIIPALEESVQLVRRGYQTGVAAITFADVLLAEQSLSEARLRLAEARQGLGRAIADLEGQMQLGIGEELDCSSPAFQEKQRRP